MCRLILLLLLALVSSLSASAGGEEKKPAAPAAPPYVVSEEAMRIHREALVVDGHNDLPWEYREVGDLSFQQFDISKPQPRFHTDIPRLRKGGVGAQFWSAYVPARTRKDGTAVGMTLEQIDAIHRLVRRHPETFEMALSVDDILRIRKAGKIASLIGLEGGHSIEDSIGTLRLMYNVGARYMTLTHSETLDWADSATDQPKNNGLSAFGEQVVQEMNRLGMLVDISHVSHDTMRHVLRVTKSPVIASHSSAYALAQHNRNVPDDVLKLLPKNGGVVMVNFYPGFISPEGARASKDLFQVARQMREKYPKEADFRAAMRQWRQENPLPTVTLQQVVDHIEHIIKTAGIDHVGLGSDFDGISAVPRHLEDVSCYPNITQELLTRGYKRDDIVKVLGGNVLRAFRAAEAVAKGK